MNLPKISIILPVYKSKDYLYKIFDCLQNQSLKEIEIIFVNDGSPDDSAIIIEEIAKTDDRIILINQLNSGAASAVQKGVEVAKGDYLMILDADDWIDKNTCEETYNIAVKEDADMVFWTFYKEFPSRSVKAHTVFSENRIFKDDSIKWLRRRFFGLLDDELMRPFMNDAISTVWGKLYRRTIITGNNIKLIDTNLVGSTDVLYNIQLAKYINKAVYLHSYFNHYRQDNPTSLTKNYQFTLFNKYLHLFEYAKSEIEYYHSFEKTKIQLTLNNRISCSIINISLSLTSAKINESHIKRISHLNEVLCNPVYSSALKELQIGYLPLHWRVFFMFCKLRLTPLVYMMAVAMSKMRK